MTVIWFVIWLIWNNVGDKEPLTFENVWGSDPATARTYVTTRIPLLDADG